MRIVFVVEVLEGGEFQPKVGFAERALLDAWMEKFLPHEKLSDLTQWRIVRYGPLVTPIANGPLN